jgi:hypothetical protein
MDHIGLTADASMHLLGGVQPVQYIYEPTTASHFIPSECSRPGLVGNLAQWSPSFHVVVVLRLPHVDRRPGLYRRSFRRADVTIDDHAWPRGCHRRRSVIIIRRNSPKRRRRHTLRHSSTRISTARVDASSRKSIPPNIFAIGRRSCAGISPAIVGPRRSQTPSQEEFDGGASSFLPSSMMKTTLKSDEPKSWSIARLASPPGVVGISIVVVHGDRRRLQCSSSAYPFFRLRRKIHRQLPNIRPKVEDAQDAIVRGHLFLSLFTHSLASRSSVSSLISLGNHGSLCFLVARHHTNRKASSLIHARSSADLSFLGEADDGTSPRGNDGRSFPRN